MRPIKFRAYEFAKKRMLYTDWNSPHNLYDSPSGGKVVYERRFDGEQTQLSKPMQFTGLNSGCCHRMDADELKTGTDKDGARYRVQLLPDLSGVKEGEQVGS